MVAGLNHYQKRNSCCKMSDVSGGLRLPIGKDKSYADLVVTGLISEG
jgi:hypothetical protein